LPCKGTKFDLGMHILGFHSKGANKSAFFQTPSPITIQKNNYGNYVHEQTELVFDSLSKCVIGRQKKNGEIEPLTRDDISLCRQYKFRYFIPENINSMNEEEQELFAISSFHKLDDEDNSDEDNSDEDSF